MDTLLSRTVATSATQHQSSEHCQDNHLVDGFYVTLELVGWPYPLLKCQVDTEDAGRKVQKNTTINHIYYTINKTMLPQRHNHRKLKMPLKVKKKNETAQPPCFFLVFLSCFLDLLPPHLFCSESRISSQIIMLAGPTKTNTMPMSHHCFNDF